MIAASLGTSAVVLNCVLFGTESHHAATCWAAIQRSGLIGHFKPPALKLLRKLIVNAILATDSALLVNVTSEKKIKSDNISSHKYTTVSTHKELLARTMLRLEPGSGGPMGSHHGPTGFCKDSLDDRVRVFPLLPHGARALPTAAAPCAHTCFAHARQVLLTSFLLHCADLNCPLLPPPLSRRIAFELSQEFEAQSRMERASFLPVTVMTASTDAAKARLEVGFIGARREPALSLAHVSPPSHIPPHTFPTLFVHPQIMLSSRCSLPWR